KLADALESGADKLRQRGKGGQLSGSTGTTDVIVTGDGVNQVTDRVAGGMQATAEWLREADLDNMRMGIERQVKEHPGRTLLIAVILLIGDQWLPRDLYWLAALIVAVISGGVAAWFTKQGLALLSPAQLAPDETVTSIRETKDELVAAVRR